MCGFFPDGDVGGLVTPSPKLSCWIKFGRGCGLKQLRVGGQRNSSEFLRSTEHAALLLHGVIELPGSPLGARKPCLPPMGPERWRTHNTQHPTSDIQPRTSKTRVGKR